MSKVYYPGFFDVANQRQAKEIILTNEGPDSDTDTRWRRETPYIVELLRCYLPLNKDSLVLDYGCGIGRIAKEIIAEIGCAVIGVDISPSMRIHAAEYVDSPQFMAVSPKQFDVLINHGLRVSSAISIWVLQHCFAPADDINRIRSSLEKDAGVFVMNMRQRAIPVLNWPLDKDEQFSWASDGVDVENLLRSHFQVNAEGEPDESRIPNPADAGAYWMDLAET